MKIQYKVTEKGVEIVRCFGTDPVIVLPEMIEGKPVIRAAAYTFSARKSKEEDDVCVFETEDHGLFREQERLLAGEDVERVDFPDTMEEIGNYIFYGCRNLRQISFSDRLMGVGSGAFTGCRSLSRLDVRLTQGERSCVKEILGDLWQRIDVRFLRADSGAETLKNFPAEVRMVFPEHYEEAVENTPARILFTQHHGSGNNYRQCFYNKEVDYRKYDELFYVARVHDQVDVLCDLVFSRLMYPYRLEKDGETAYEDYVRDSEKEVAEYLTDREDLEALRQISARGMWQEKDLDQAADYAARTKKSEILAFLMEEKHRLFPVRKKKFEL